MDQDLFLMQALDFSSPSSSFLLFVFFSVWFPPLDFCFSFSGWIMGVSADMCLRNVRSLLLRYEDMKDTSDIYT